MAHRVPWRFATQMLGWICAGFLVLHSVAIGDGSTSPGTVTATQIDLLNNDGELVGRWSALDSGSALDLMYQRNEFGVRISVGDTGARVLLRGQGFTGFGMRLAADDLTGGGIELWDSESNPTVTLQSLNAGELLLYNEVGDLERLP